MSRGSTAKRVREDKERHQERYCPAPNCLWRTGGEHGTPCQKHGRHMKLKPGENTVRVLEPVEQIDLAHEFGGNKMTEKLNIVHVAGARGPVQRCIRCGCVLHDQAKHGLGGWHPGAAVVSFGHGSMRVAKLHELDYGNGTARPCGPAKRGSDGVETLALATESARG